MKNAKSLKKRFFFYGEKKYDRRNHTRGNSGNRYFRSREYVMTGNKKYDDAYLAQAGKNAADQRKTAANAEKNYQTAVHNLNNLKNLVEENPNLVGPYAPISAAVSRYTGGTLGMNADNLRKRGEVIRNLGSIRNDLIAQAKANGQSGINTAREIEMATAGLNENSSAEEILGALDYMTEAAEKIHELSVSDMAADNVVDFSNYF